MVDFDVVINLILQIIELPIFVYFVISFAVFCIFVIVKNLFRGDF